MTTIQAHVHHLYLSGPAQDLVPFCNQTPGPDPETGDWHTGHDRAMLLEYLAAGQVCCMTCVSPEALGDEGVFQGDPATFDEFHDEPVWADDEPC